MNDQDLLSDWLYLPKYVSAESLWSCLHDSSLNFVNSAPVERTASFGFSIAYLQGFQGIPADAIFEFRFDEVQSIRSTCFVLPPIPFEELPGETREQRGARIARWQGRGREESAAWRSIEERLTQEAFDVVDAELAEGGQTVALRIQAVSDVDGRLYAIFCRATSLQVVRSDGCILAVRDLIACGQAYWDSLGS